MDFRYVIFHKVLLKSPDVDNHFSGFFAFLERTANGDVIFTLKTGGPIE